MVHGVQRAGQSPQASAWGRRPAKKRQAGLQPGEDAWEIEQLGPKPSRILFGLLPRAEARGDYPKPD